MPTVGSLFSGVEGFGMGMEAAGFSIEWMVEIDNDAVSVLERHYPNVRRYRDIREAKGAALAPVDVLVGGFPCQDLSVAGKQAGLSGARSGLFWEAVRIVREMREETEGRYPAVVILENVPGLLSSNGGRDFAAVLGGLRELGAAVAWRICDAQFFGVPQRRRRVFIVADFAPVGLGEARAASVLSLTESLCRHSQEGNESRQGAAGLSEDGAGSGGVAGTLRSHPRPGSNSSGAIVPEVAYTLRSNNNGKGVVAHALTAHGGSHGRIDAEPETFVAVFDERNVTSGANRTRCAPGLPSNTLHSEPQSIVAVAFDWQKGDGGNDHSWRGKSRGWIERAGDYAGSLSATKHDEVAFHLMQDPINGAESRALGTESTVGIAHSLTTRSGATEDGTGRGTPRAASHADDAWSVRRLMPVECERLMGWPDGHTAFRADGTPIKDGPRYRLIGNGVVRPVAAWIGRRLLRALEQQP